MSVRIIVDSACDITAGAMEHLSVVPLSIAFGETIYQDGVNLSHRRFYELLVESDELPTTGQVTPYQFEQAIREAHGAGDDVVLITVSSKLSGTYESALIARERVCADGCAHEVHVVDSLSVTLGERLLVERALQLVEEGWCAADIAAEIERLRSRVVLLGLLDTLEFLRRGGRISPAAGAVGELLSFKPVVTVENGEVVLLGKARGSKNGRNLLTQRIEVCGGVDFSLPVCLGYAGLSDALLQKYVRDSRALWEAYPGKMLPLHTVGASIGTHVGPGAIAVAFFGNRVC